MKHIQIVFVSIMLLTIHLVSAQELVGNHISSEKDDLIHLEAGINASLPVHIMMYRSHRLAIGVNARAWKKISPRWELGVKADYDYRFIKSGSRITASDTTLKERARHSNFSLISIKPNGQFNLNRGWYLGAETGVGYVISDADSKFGMGFVSEFAGPQQFGICSGLYVGKYFNVGRKKKELSLSMDFTQFLAHWHAENSLGFKLKYRFLN